MNKRNGARRNRSSQILAGNAVLNGLEKSAVSTIVANGALVTHHLGAFDRHHDEGRKSVEVGTIGREGMSAFPFARDAAS